MQNHCTILTRFPQKIFNDVARDDPVATEVSFSQCESSMYRSRRRSQPKIPSNAIQLSDMLPTTTFGNFHKRTVSLDGQTALIFFSDKIVDLMPQMNDIQFDGTFYCVPRQFYQLWTIFVSVGRHSLPAIHCLMTGKEQGLYIRILESIRDLIPVRLGNSSTRCLQSYLPRSSYYRLLVSFYTTHLACNTETRTCSEF